MVERAELKFFFYAIFYYFCYISISPLYINNLTLKRLTFIIAELVRFICIQINITLKRKPIECKSANCFIYIQNFITLKKVYHEQGLKYRFNYIQSNLTFKPSRRFKLILHALILIDNITTIKPY